MTIPEVQAAAATLAQQITAQVQAFEASTGCIVHSLPVRGEKNPTTVEVKVQVP